MPKVLLTGGTGFVATHILELLLKRGYEVVTTVRSEEKANIIRNAHPGAKLTVAIVPDIGQPNAFDQVLQTPGLDYVQHTASPFHFRYTDPKTEMLDPAINGTRFVLQAVKKYAPTVKRVVITSSIAAMVSEEIRKKGASKTLSEADWNPHTYEEGVNAGLAYPVSKALAEKAAWEFKEKENPNFDIATINPPFIYGPVVPHLGSLANVNTSNSGMADLISGKWKNEIPPVFIFLWVDVRDVAKAHVEAMERPEAGGHRFFVAAGHYNNRAFVPIVRKHFPQLAGKLPDDSTPGGDFPGGSKDNVYGYDNSKATNMLGINWIPFEKSVKDTVESLLAFGTN
ncbi:NAD dependent epimerase/dehydratase [Xylaria nigripes]|nr:NAD dependent epimerase/dehydratase [Xylaria nigripes]